MTAFDPIFGGQMVEVDPHRLNASRTLPLHGFAVSGWQPTRESLDHDVGGFCHGVPGHDVHAAAVAAFGWRWLDQRQQHRRLVDQQTHDAAGHLRQRARQSQADASVAVVVDHPADHVPALRRYGFGHVRSGREAGRRDCLLTSPARAGDVQYEYFVYRKILA